MRLGETMPEERAFVSRRGSVGVVTLALAASWALGACGPPPAPEELPPRFVFRMEFKDPCNQPIPGVQFELYADPLERRPVREDGTSIHEWRAHVRGQADEFGSARVDLGTDWGTLVDLYATFAGQISEVRAAPDCYIEVANRNIIEVVLDTYSCAKSRRRMKKAGGKPAVKLYARAYGDTYRKRRRIPVQCRDKLPPEPPEEVEARLKRQKRLR